MEPSRSDDELLVAAGRDPEAFSAFYRRHGDAVLRYLVHRTRTRRRRPSCRSRGRPGAGGLPRSVRVRALVAVLPADAEPRTPVGRRFKAG